MVKVGSSNVIGNTSQIVDGVIQGADLADAAITQDKIADEAVGTDAIEDASIANADIASDASIDDTKLATINEAGKVDGAALTGLANIPSGAGKIPAANYDGFVAASGITTQSKNVTTDLTIAHGLGTTPKLVRITCFASPATNANAWSIGTATDNTNERCMSFNPSTGTGDNSLQTSGAIIKLLTDDETVAVLADIKTIDSTNIVIQWTTNNNNGGDRKILWEAIG